MSEFDDLARAIVEVGFKRFAKSMLVIKDEAGQQVPFELNEAQQIVDDAVEKQLATGLPVKILILKGRQQGMSTYCQMRFVYKLLCTSGLMFQTVGHLLPATRSIASKFDFAVKKLPDVVRPSTKSGGDRGRLIEFDEPNDCVYQADSAHDPDSVGRGATINCAHLTEIPQWKSPSATMQALLESIPDNRDTMIFIETTARGASGWFYDEWRGAVAAMRRGEHPEFIPVFVPWFMTKRYRRKIRSGERPLSGSEKKLMLRYGLDVEQMLWYRDKRRKHCERVSEEYPFTWEEAFLSSGMSFFPQDKMSEQRSDRLIDPLKRGMWVRYSDSSRMVFREYSEGEAFVFETPQEGYSYSIGMDIASGRAADFSAIVVVCVETMSVVYSMRTKISPDDLIEQAVAIGKWYKSGSRPALIIPERTGIGQVPVDRLVREYAYPNVYRERDSTSRINRRSMRYGFATTASSRPRLLEDLASKVQSGECSIRDGRILDEMEAFVYTGDSGSKAQASGSNHDDMVIATALAVRGALSMIRGKHGNV